ncbi:MAG TPA: asparagine synthase (glutamine-hydrolyzing) [Steroidobacteraceae bacterium]|nr:asparagine synthase (glutamine-hydrolyzing) [Steroidobacteraceae bacterium]
MCGIAGFLQIGGLSPRAARGELAAMAASLSHRGPDDEGFWLAPAAGVALCHRRLSVIDLSPLGSQPMRSASGRFTVTFNGEIYNFRALRAELLALGNTFRGGSDTEVLLAAVEQWGVMGALERSRGMLALGLWDEAEHVLWLARDRFGEKPLYYADFGRVLVFGSELKALRRHSAWNTDIDRDVLGLFLRRGFVPAPHTIFQRVRKVRPGCALRICVDGSRLRIEEREYWRPSLLAEASEPGDRLDEHSLVEQVHAALEDSIRLQMVADVPVGAFLSGGIDSSLVVALMQRASTQPVRTYSIGFAEEGFNEAPYARRVADHLGTRHTELIVSSRDALDVIPRLPQMYDEPFGDSSQIPTFLVSSLARRDVTVALSGDGGDELFGGYARYLSVRDRWLTLQRAPAALRRCAARMLERTPAWALGPVTAPALALSRWRGRQQVADRIQERASGWGASSLPELYDALTAFWQPAERFVLGARSVRRAPEVDPQTATAGPIAQMMYADTCSYLPDDILVKVDRAAMAVSLETRVPLLDAQVARAAWRIPAPLHLKDGKGKWVLRQLLERHVPRALFDRPKSGFAVPVAHWLRRDLREWADALLDPAVIRRDGYFAAAPIQRRWRQHMRAEMDWSFHLWSVLMFQAWLADFARHDSTASSSLWRDSGRARAAFAHSAG